MNGEERAPEADGPNAAMDLGPIEELTDLERWERYLESDIALQRLIIARDVAAIAKTLGLADTLQHVVPKIPELVRDQEVAVRQTISEQIPNLAKYLVDTGDEDAYNEVKGSLLTVLAGALSDFHTQVRESGAAAVVSLAEHLRPEDRHDRVVSLLLDLARADDAEKRMVSALLMNQLAEGLGQQVCLEKLAPELVHLSDDQMFRVRKNVALNLGGVCQALGPELSEEHIWPVYTKLCKDEIWGVRKACAESIVPVARGVSQEMRGKEVLDMFWQFVDDVSRWVRNCVFQQLGPLIATLTPEQVSADIVKMFTTMSDVKDPRWEETDMQSYCAFNFPAVAVTIGRSRWSELSKAYHVLVFGVHEKVRRSLSHSLHEIAAIVGTETTEASLLSVFELFLRDLDEVKAGVLKNLAKLLSVLSPPFREKYLHVLTDIQDSESDHWRFRRLLAAQLDELAALYTPAAVAGTIVPLAIKLCRDPVAAVRIVAHDAMGHLVARVSQGDDEARTREVLEQLYAFGAEKSYQGRQMFANMCLHIVRSGLDESIFVRELLPMILKLAQDPVANVRVGVAQFLSDVLSTNQLASRRADLEQVLRGLESDADGDVRYYAAATPDKASGPEVDDSGQGLGQIAHDSWKNEL